MSKRLPKRSEGFELEALTPHEFELLCHQLVEIENPTAVKLRPSDLGADSLLPSTIKRHGYDRAWQAKRHTTGIKWTDCEGSLDAAVANYAIPHMTFCFPFDLTGSQELKFDERLRQRHAAKGVKVDYWGRSRLEKLMTGSDQGARVAERFFSSQDAGRMVARAFKAGGPLDSIDAMAARAFALGEFAAGNDPLFEYPTEISEVSPGIRTPPSREGSLMSLSFTDNDLVVTTHAVPRAGADVPLPTGQFLLDEVRKDPSQLEKLNRVMQGGKATFENAGLSISNVPPMFKDLLRDVDSGRLVLHTKPVPAPYSARVSIDSSVGGSELDFNLEAVEAGPDWDAELRGSNGTIEVSLKFQWDHDVGRGGFSFEWSYSHTTETCSNLKTQLEFFRALCSEGTLTISDREGNRPPLTHPTPNSELPEQIRAMLELVAKLDVIKGFIGAEIEVPEEITQRDADSVFVVAEAIVKGGYAANFTRATMSLPTAESRDFANRTLTDLEIRQTVRCEVFGEEFALCESTVKIPPVICKSVKVDSLDAQMSVLELAPASANDATVWMPIQPDPS